MYIVQYQEEVNVFSNIQDNMYKKITQSKTRMKHWNLSI